MKELKDYVERQNQWSGLFNKPALSLDSAADRQKIAQSIDCDLSPENLTCDGELTRSQVNEKYRRLTRAAEQLMKLDPSVEIHEYY